MLVSLEAYQRNLAISSKQQVSTPLCIYSFDEGKMRHYLLSNFSMLTRRDPIVSKLTDGITPIRVGFIRWIGILIFRYVNSFVSQQLHNLSIIANTSHRH